MDMINICLVVFVAITSVKSDFTSFPVVGIFDDDSLEKSIEAFNNLQNGPKVYHGSMLRPTTRDSYSTSMELCEHSIEEKGISAILDVRPTNGICDTVCLISNEVQVPHLSIGWQPIAERRKDDDENAFPYTLSYYPDPEQVSKAYATLIRDVLDWDKFTILYEEEESFIRLREIIHSWPYEKEPILFRKLDPTIDNRETFKYIFKVAKMSYHIIDCKVENIIKYMKEVEKVENSTKYASFLFTSLESFNLDFDELPSNIKANFSTFSIMLNDQKDTWIDYKLDTSAGDKMETALVADALRHLEVAIGQLQPDKEKLNFEGVPPPTICRSSEESKWETGSLLREALLNTSITGFTGPISFDSDGKRTKLALYYYKRIGSGGFTYGGKWESDTNIISLPDEADSPVVEVKPGAVEFIQVGFKEPLPYFEIVTHENGTVEYRGYAKDLIEMIFDDINKENNLNLQIEYKIYKGIGSRIEGTKRWTEMMGALIDHEIDMAICDLGITSERLEIVDFSTPFMATGISMLMKEKEPEPPNKFSFLEPLSLDVWLYLGTTYIVVSFIMFICARMSQDDWVNPHPCNQNPENLENIWSLYNCTWLTMGAIMTQGCDILPRGFGSRWIAGLWWFFSLIVTASYTANMSTFLSNSRRSTDIRDAKMLSEQNTVSYGAVTNSSTYKFFEKSNDPVYQKLWATMKSAKPEVFTSSNEEGQRRVRRSKGNYAFFMESTAIRYYTERYCDLKMVGHHLDAKEYGIAMPKNFEYKHKVDVAILHLQEQGNLTTLETKWWVVNDNIAHCKEEREKEKKKGKNNGSLQMENTSGIFMVLGAGTILGAIVSVIDFMMHAHEICVKERVTFKEALASELRASLDPRSLRKPAAPPRSPQSSRSPSPLRDRSQSRAASVLRAASSFINFDEIY